MSDINTLRDHLFSTLQGLKDGTITVETAKTIAEVGQVLINTAKVEVDYVRANNGGKSQFFLNEVKEVKQTPTGTVSRIGSMTVHNLG